MIRAAIAASCAALFLVACGSEAVQVAVTSPPTAAPTPTPTPDPALGRFDVAKAMDHVRALSVEIGQREAGSPGDLHAADYISERFERIGWTAREQTFLLPQGGESSNVIGTPPSFDDTEPYVMVGAHRDSFRGPGANDNASGVAVVLDIARAVDAIAAPLPVMAVAWGAEERQPYKGQPSRVGSRFFVSRMSQAARSNLVVYVNLDVVGHGASITCGRLDVGPRDGTARCVSEAKELGIDAVEKELPDWSDHGPFQQAGLNASWVWTGDVACCYHNPRDTIDNVRPHDLRRSAELALAIVRSYESTE